MTSRSSTMSTRRLSETFVDTSRLLHMTRGKHDQARRSVDAACRERRRAKMRCLRREAWVSPFWRAHRALDRSFRLIVAGLRTASASRRRAHRRPSRSSREIHDAAQLLVRASSRLRRAALELAKMNASIARDPGTGSDAPEVLADTTEHWAYLSEWL